MPANKTNRRLPLIGLITALSGVSLLVLGWFLPVGVNSVHPKVLSLAARGTPSIIDHGVERLSLQQPGPAGMALRAARQAGIGDASELQAVFDSAASTHPSLLESGGNDPVLEDLPGGSLTTGESKPAMVFLLPETRRKAIRGTIERSTSGNLRLWAGLLTVRGWGHFQPVDSGGGQLLETVILMSALLDKGGHFSPGLEQELHALLSDAGEPRNAARLEAFFLDLVALSKRLDWVSLAQLFHHFPDTQTASHYAHFANVNPRAFPLIYTSTLMTENGGALAEYVATHGESGIEDLGTAARLGQGALALLLDRRARILPAEADAPAPLASLALKLPAGMQVLRILCFFGGAGLFVFGMTAARPPPVVTEGGEAARLQPLRSAVLALLFSLILVALGEPFLFNARQTSEYEVKERIIPVQPPPAAETGGPGEPEESMALAKLDISTIYSVAVFLLAQVLVYVICMQTIFQIKRRKAPPLLKLKLMENEENLFDMGLYVGIAGTAAALTLQVMDVIKADLVAAYSSNLFGITCVALVKICHVRPYKQRLIMMVDEFKHHEVPTEETNPLTEEYLGSE